MKKQTVEIRLRETDREVLEVAAKNCNRTLPQFLAELAEVHAAELRPVNATVAALVQ